MPSAFVAFDLVFEDDAGAQTPAGGVQIVHVYDVTNGVALDDTEADANGHVGGGTLDVDAGTVVRFSAQRPDGFAGFAEQVTVEA